MLTIPADSPSTTPSRSADDIDLEFDLADYAEPSTTAHRAEWHPEKPTERKSRTSVGATPSYFDEPSLEERMAVRAEEAYEAELRSWKRPLKYIAFGIICIFFAVYFYFNFHHAPTHGGIRKNTWLLPAAKLFGGVWGVVALLSFAAAGNFFAAILHFRGVILEDDD